MFQSKTMGAAFLALAAALKRIGSIADDNPIEAKVRLVTLERVLMHALATVRSMQARLDADVLGMVEDALVDRFAEQLDSLPTIAEPEGDAA